MIDVDFQRGECLILELVLVVVQLVLYAVNYSYDSRHIVVQCVRKLGFPYML
jgi:hypothetical protein